MPLQNDQYKKLIDTDTWAFIDQTNAAFPDSTTELSLQEQRASYDHMCQSFHAGCPDNVSRYDSQVTDAGHHNVSTRHYERGVSHHQPSDSSAQIIYLHGGGFVVGGLESHDDVCAEICHRTGHRVTAADYSLSPECKHPTALNDTMLVIRRCWEEHRQPIVLCGDSAGANLAAASCHLIRNGNKAEPNSPPQIVGQVLIYAALGGDTSKGSYIEHANAPMLSTLSVVYYNNMRRSQASDDNDPTFAPLKDNDFTQLPPTVAFSAQCDPVRDDSRDYCELIAAAGGKAHWIDETGMVHGYLRARHSVQRATDSFTRIIEAISALAAHRWPY